MRTWEGHLAMATNMGSTISWPDGWPHKNCDIVVEGGEMVALLVVGELEQTSER